MSKATENSAADFADRLRALRIQAGISIYRLAQLTGVTRQQLGRLESGKQQPSWDTVWRLADALGTSTEDFRPTKTERSP